MKPKKIAIFHNFMDNIGGAEIVTLTLAKELNAVIYTTNIDKEKINKMGFSDLKLISLGKIPINAPFRHQLALHKFKKLNLKDQYDFYIISGDWAISGATNNKPNLWYAHGPLNELYEFRTYVREKMMNFYKRPIFDLWVLVNRFLIQKYLKRAQILVCNSKNTQNRIKKYLKRNATVINPPINTLDYKFKKHKNYWLSVNRLLDHKRVAMQLKAFQKLPNENLIIVGSYEKSRHFLSYANYCKKIKPKNVKILSWVDYKELLKLYSECKGFITTSRNEDFGMTPIEAMASGKPVIAPNEGGYKESIINNKTGILIKNINSDKLIQAIKDINKQLKSNPNKYKKPCQTQSKKFDTKEFIKKIKQQIKNAE